MAKNNIEKDLLKELKSINQNEIVYCIFKMINGDYKYNIKHLNNVSYNILMVYLEKILEVIDYKDLASQINVDDEALKVYEIFQKLKIKDLKSNQAINIKYFMKLRAAEAKTFFSEKKKNVLFGVGTGFIILALLFFINGKKLENESEIKESKTRTEKEIEDDEIKDEETISYGIDETLEQEEPIELSLDEKIAYILDEYNLTQEQFDVLCAIVISEAWVDSYEDAYAVINTIYNRSISRNWVDWINKNVGENTGRSLYYQATFKDQFVVYQEGIYLKNMGRKEGPAYDAVIDFLMTKEIKHDFLEFRANYCEVEGVQFTEKGNFYFHELDEEDRITNEMTR